MEAVSIVISVSALAVSVTTAWLTLVRRGTIRMTQPTLVFFGPDGGGGSPKVFLRTLLYSTAKRGQIVENMFLKLQTPPFSFERSTSGFMEMAHSLEVAACLSARTASLATTTFFCPKTAQISSGYRASILWRHTLRWSGGGGR